MIRHGEQIRFGRGDVARYFSVRFPDVVQRGKEWRMPCPVHRGTRDSFSVNSETGQCFCHSKCDRGFNLVQLEIETQGTNFFTAKKNVFEMIGRADEPRNTEKQSLGPIVATYDYTDESGTPLYQITRHFPPRDFRQRYPDGNGGWVHKKHPQQVLYRLPKVLASQIVFCTEGERDVETLEAHGFVATTKAGGAGSAWLPEYTEALRHKELILLPDNDLTGIECGARTASALLGHVARLKWLDFPGAKDVTEWFEAGHSEVELIQLVEAGLEFPN